MRLTKKEGFTLIELLAVIVIIGIVLLIAVPLILNVIDNTRKGAFKSSADYLLKAAENKYMLNQMNNKNEDIIVTYENGRVISSYDLDYRGEKPDKGTIVVRQDGKVGMAIDNGKWCILKNYNAEEITLMDLKEDNCKLSEIPEQPKKIDQSGANVPKLVEGMTAVAWDENNNEYVPENIDDPYNQNWYNYGSKLWANAKTADGSYWVWIPRYAYKITNGYHTSTIGNIDVKFLKERTNETIDNELVEITGYEVGVKDTSMHYFLHPAFEFDGDIMGFWVAKFEPSGTSNNISILPNKTSIRSMKIGDQFNVAYNLKNNSKYGWDVNEVDTHMMKSSEWGAVAYLSKSVYGANAEIYRNNSSTFTTGCAGNTVFEAAYNGCQNPYDTPKGIKASTTHNITGIYDMSGGANEYVASYINNAHTNLTTNGNSIINAMDKYKDKYIGTNPDTQVNHYENNKNKYGNAMYETSLSGTESTSWFGGASNIPYSSYPWFSYGGYSANSLGGIFSFSSGSGPAGSPTFRPIVLPIE